jgi:Cu2+-exporting ATPase
MMEQQKRIEAQALRSSGQRHRAHCPSMKSCTHCNTAFSPRSDEDRFCCHGCEFVYQMINDQGLDQFYTLKQGLATVPVKSRPFEEHDFSWLPAMIVTAEAEAKEEANLDLALDGISCVGCVWMIETIFARYSGSIRASAHPTQGLLHLEWLPGHCDIAAFLKEITQFGYVAAPRDQRSGHGEQQKLMARMGLCGAFALNAMAFSLPTYFGMPRDFMFADLFRLITFLSATFAILVGGTWFMKKAWRALQMGTVHIDLPIALGLIAAYIGSIIGWLMDAEGLLYFDFVAMFVFLMLLGRALQTSAVERNRKRLVRQQPVPKAFDATRDDLPAVSLDEIKADTQFSLRPGQANPVASMVQSSDASFSLEWINGEADAVNFAVGSRLPAGAILLSRSPVIVQASEQWLDSLLARLTAPPVAERGHAFLDTLLRYWLAAIVIIGIAGFAWHAFHHEWIRGLQVMISVFVVSCPCALGVAIPLADDLAATRLQHWGVFLRSTTFWSRIRKVKHIIFDKTGTLTLERPLLSNPCAVQDLDEDSARALAILTHGSLHPVSRTLLETLGTRGQKLLRAASEHSVLETAGQGIEWKSDDVCWSLGRPGWKSAEHITEGQSTELCRNGKCIARFAFEDALRPSAVAALASLRADGIMLHIFSGDHREKVAKIAKQLGISEDQAHGGLLPEEKAASVRKIDSRNTLYMGDGANDSLAFDAAYVTGTPVTDRSLLESKSDFYTLGSGLSFLPQLFTTAKARAQGVRHVFLFALIYNVIVVSLSLMGQMNPLLAAVLMPLSSLISIALIAISLKNRSSLIEKSNSPRYDSADVTRREYVTTKQLS